MAEKDTRKKQGGAKAADTKSQGRGGARSPAVQAPAPGEFSQEEALRRQRLEQLAGAAQAPGGQGVSLKDAAIQRRAAQEAFYRQAMEEAAAQGGMAQDGMAMAADGSGALQEEELQPRPAMDGAADRPMSPRDELLMDKAASGAAGIGRQEEFQLPPGMMLAIQPDGTAVPVRVGTVGKIGRAEVDKAMEILKKYKSGKAHLEARVIDNEQWWKLRHWEQIRSRRTPGDPEPASAWLFNSIANKHADAMDNYPEANVLPREESDKGAARQLSAILPVVFEQNDFEQTYNDAWWYKLKTGTGVYGIFWNSAKNGGVGDIEIRQLDLLNLFWEPGVKDIQKSRHMFHVELADNDLLEEQYPQLKGRLKNATIDVARYIYDDSVDTSEKSAVVDWYYKLSAGGTEVLHYCKFCNGEVLYASENDPAYAARGYYDHGRYPFVFDVLFQEEGTPCGFGYIDIMKDPQMYIDKLNQVILKNALLAGKKRFFIKDNGSVNEKEFADWSKDFVHVTSSSLGEDSIREIITQPLSGIYVNILNSKIEELKETSGNRDFSQGGTTGGVTAASAIAALQEAGSKLSRDMIKSAYRAFTKLNCLCIELIRQFYDEPRCFRILGPQGQEQYLRFDNRSIQQKNQGGDFGLALGERAPVFDIKIRSQKANPFSKIAQNELAKEFFAMGFFNPQAADQALACMDMMDFEGKDMIVQKVSENGTMMQTLQQMQAQMMQMAALLEAQAGSQGETAGDAAGREENPQAGEPGKAGASSAGSPQDGRGGSGGRRMETDPLGRTVRASRNSAVSKARERAGSAANPK